MKKIIMLVLALLFIPLFNLNGLAQEQKSFNDYYLDRFAETSLLPVIKRLSTDYPIPELREKFAKMVEKINNGTLKLSATNSVQIPMLFSVHVLENGMHNIIMSVPYTKEFYDKDVELFRDIVVAGMLHENYHIDQGHTKLKTETLEEKKYGILCESDTCWWQAKNIVMVMVKNGRLKKLPKTDFLYLEMEAYKKSKNQKSKAWVDFVNEHYLPMLTKKITIGKREK